MDENTIFSREMQEMPPPSAPPVPPVQVVQPVSEGVNPPPGAASEDNRSSKLPLIFKALVGLSFIALLVFIVITFVLPFFYKNKTEQVTLTYWGLWEDQRVIQPIIDDFQKQNPQIKVTYIKQDSKQYRERLVARIQNGMGPDIFRFHNTWLPQLKNVLLPLSSDAIKREDFQKWFYNVSQKDLVRDGAIYGIPLGIDTLALFTNTEALNAAGVMVPTTWNDFGNTARLLTVKDENGKIKTAGVAMGTYDNVAHAPDIISLLLVQNGADIRNLSGTSKNASDALDYYTSFARGDSSVWDDTFEFSTIAFANGSLAMYFGYSWDVYTIKRLNPDLNFDISDVPSLPGRKMTIASYWSEGVSAKTKHQKESMLFMKFLSLRETGQKFYSETAKSRLFGEPYARADLAGFVKGNKLVYPFVSQANGAVSSFFASDTLDNGLNDQMNGYLGNAIRGITVNNTSAQTAVEILAQGVTQVLNQYGE